MTALKEWVRELTVLVILGTCLELLIPMGSMKKYIRMTMGLVVVLAVVSPIAAFLGRPVVVETLSLGEPNDGRLPSVNEIMVQARQFQERNQSQALEEARRSLGAEARAAAEGVSGVAEARAEITLQKRGEEYAITAVVVTVTPGSKPGAVKPVEPVKSGATPSQQGGTEPREPLDAEAPMADAVRRAVAGKLGVEFQAVRVQLQRR